MSMPEKNKDKSENFRFHKDQKLQLEQQIIEEDHKALIVES